MKRPETPVDQETTQPAAQAACRPYLLPKLAIKPKEKDGSSASPPSRTSLPPPDGDPSPSPPSKMKSWFLNRFSRHRPKSSNAATEDART